MVTHCFPGILALVVFTTLFGGCGHFTGKEETKGFDLQEVPYEDQTSGVHNLPMPDGQQLKIYTLVVEDSRKQADTGKVGRTIFKEVMSSDQLKPAGKVYHLIPVIQNGEQQMIIRVHPLDEHLDCQLCPDQD